MARVGGPQASVGASVSCILQVGHECTCLSPLTISDCLGPSVRGQERQALREAPFATDLQTMVVAVANRFVTRHRGDVGIGTHGVEVPRPGQGLVGPSSSPEPGVLVPNISDIQNDPSAQVALNTKIPCLQIRGTAAFGNISELHASWRQSRRWIVPVPTLKVAQVVKAIIEADKWRVDSEKDELIERLRLIENSVSAAQYGAIGFSKPISKSNPGRKVVIVRACQCAACPGDRALKGTLATAHWRYRLARASQYE